MAAGRAAARPARLVMPADPRLRRLRLPGQLLRCSLSKSTAFGCKRRRQRPRVQRQPGERARSAAGSYAMPCMGLLNHVCWAARRKTALAGGS